MPIEFEWREDSYKHEYHINWNVSRDGYQVLYLHYRNISPILKIDDNNELVFIEKDNRGCITISPRGGYNYDAIPRLSPAVYLFELKETNEGWGDCIPGKSKEICTAPKIEVIKEEISYKGNFSKLQIKSKYKIPNTRMELYIPSMPDERFAIHDMKRSSDSFYKSDCLIKSGMSKNIKIRFDEHIEKIFHTTEV